jgi:small subunit ribosomal protein S7
MRRRRAEKRQIIPDIKYESELVARFINYVMLSGKKSVARRIVYDAMETVANNVGSEDVLEAFTQALDNIKPQLEVKSRRVGGATYQVPVEVPGDRQVALAMRWLIGYARGRKGMPMGNALARELEDAYNNTGSCIKKRDDTHKMAAANKAFAHYRW